MALLGSGGGEHLRALGVRRGAVQAACCPRLPRPPASRVLIGLLLAVVSGPKLDGQAASEYQVKAAFLYNFAKFVDWPGQDPASDPFNLCIVGEDPFGGFLDQMVKGKAVKGHGIDIKRVASGAKIEGCRIVFVGAAERKRTPAILEGLRRAEVLTVGETEDFTRLGGVIGFYMEGNHERFEINLGAAERARLKISSKLLSLARIVKESGPGGPGGKT